MLGRQVQAEGRLNGEVRRLRADIGYIFQQFNLVGRISVLQNVLLGCLGRMPRWRGSVGLFSAEEQQRAMQALARVGLADLAQQRASTLSGGQQQRVAIARALCQRAKVILADEPIASLDPESARKVMQILADINREDGTTVVVTLHQVDYAMRYCQRAVALKAGRIHFDGAAAELHPNFLNDLYGAELAVERLPIENAHRARTFRTYRWLWPRPEFTSAVRPIPICPSALGVLCMFKRISRVSRRVHAAGRLGSRCCSGR